VISRRFKVAVVAGGVFGAVAAAGFGPLVRWQAGKVADRYGGAVEIAQVVPTWHGARLRGVDVTVADMPSVKVHLDEVEVSYGTGGRTVELRGGAITAVGARDVILRQAEVWKSRHASDGGGAGAKGGGGKTAVAGFSVSWKNDAQAPTEAVSASEVSFSRDDEAVRVSAGTASVSLGRASLEVKGGAIRLLKKEGGGYRIGELRTEGLEAQLAVPRKGEPSAVRVAAPPPEADTPATSSPRAAIVAAARALDGALGPGAKVRLGGVHARVAHGDDSVMLGPGVLEVAREAGQLVVDLRPELKAGAVEGEEEPLTFRLAVPLGDTPEDILADVRGGPIWLSSLGVKEGDFGLLDVHRASVVTRSHLVLSADGETVRIDGEGKIHNLSIRSAALSDEPVSGLELAFRLKGDGRLDGGRMHVDTGEVDLGAVRVIAQGDYERARDAHRVHGSFEIPLTPCESMLESIPKGLTPRLAGMRAAGSFALKGKAAIDTGHLDRGFVLDWDTSNTCRITEAPEAISVARFQKAFSRTAYDPEGRPVTLETGPGTPSWVSYGNISKFMEVAVLTTEDGGFRRHHGFDQEAIRNSIRENLRKKKFVRGASTISMQLAKNLYLDRGKNLSRKLQEAILTMYLEQELTKEQILELYFNVVEFGPLVYGIGPAARHYFSAPASDLSLGQALYLSSIMPNPKVQHFGAGGAVIPGWMGYLRKLMKLAHDRNHLTDEELDEGLRETVVRGSPSPHRDARPHLPGVDDVDIDPTLEGGDWLSP
jgi:Transglycosylase